MTADVDTASTHVEGVEATQAPAAPVPLTAEPAVGEATATAPPAADFPSWAPPLPDPASLPDPVFQHQQPTVQEFETALDMPARSPDDYCLPPMTEGNEPNADEMQALRGIQSLLWHGNFPVNAGDRLMQVMTEEARRVGDDMDEATFELQCNQTDASLKKIYGEEQFWALRGKLANFLTGLGSKAPGGLDAIFDAYGHILATPRVMNELFQHVDRLNVRQRR